jgi:hypothetical protein
MKKLATTLLVAFTALGVAAPVVACPGHQKPNEPGATKPKPDKPKVSKPKPKPPAA